MKGLLVTITLLFSFGCVAQTPLHVDMEHVKGPRAVSSIQTPYDDLLNCMKSSYKGRQFTLAVGAITDETGKFSIGDSGTGKFITQAAGDIVQSALLQTRIARVVNRRDPRVMDDEINHGRQLRWIGSDYHINGSINSLDFLPGGGVDATVYGAGIKYRQHRMLIGMDLALTHTVSSEVIHVASIFKQVVAEDMGYGLGRFFGTTLVSIDLGHQNREAVHFATRNMLKLATFELLSKLYGIEDNGCHAHIAQVQGVDSPRGRTVPVSVTVDPF